MKTMYALLTEDLVIGKLVGDGVGVPIPKKFAEFPIKRLRFDGENLIDAATVATWLIDEDEQKHLPAMHPDSDWQALDCNWDDALIRDAVTGDWRVEIDEDQLAAAKFEAKRKVVAFADAITDEIMNAYPKAETAGWAVKQAEAAAIIAGGDVADTVVIKALATEQALDAAGITALANAVLAKANEFAAISAAVENLRNQANVAIDAIAAIEDIPATLDALKTAGEAKATELGLG